MEIYRQHEFKQMWMLRDILVVTMFFKKEFGILPNTFAFIVDLVNSNGKGKHGIYRSCKNSCSNRNLHVGSRECLSHCCKGLHC